MKRALALIIVVVLAASTSCSSDSEQTSRPTQDRKSDDGSARYPDNDLTAFGATVANFKANHEASDDPSLAAGCCFGPLVVTASGESASTWNLAGNLGPLVINLTRNFPRGTDEAAGLGRVRNQDLPGDQTLAKSADQGECKVFVYRSYALGRAAPKQDLGPLVSVTLYSPPDPAGGTFYDESDVEQAIVTTGDGTTTDC